MGLEKELMGYEIEKQDGFFEVWLSGDGSKSLVLKAVAALMLRDPRKKHPDLWVLGPRFQVPYIEFSAIAEALARVFSSSLISKRTAIVASNPFQYAQLEMYREEVSCRIPVDLRTFASRDEAVVWIRNPDTLPPPERRR